MLEWLPTMNLVGSHITYISQQKGISIEFVAPTHPSAFSGLQMPEEVALGLHPFEHYATPHPAQGD